MFISAKHRFPNRRHLAWTPRDWITAHFAWASFRLLFRTGLVLEFSPDYIQHLIVTLDGIKEHPALTLLLRLSPFAWSSLYHVATSAGTWTGFDYALWASGAFFYLRPIVFGTMGTTTKGQSPSPTKNIRRTLQHLVARGDATFYFHDGLFSGHENSIDEIPQLVNPP